MPKESQRLGDPTNPDDPTNKELEGFVGEIVGVEGEFSLEVGQRIEFEEEGVTYRGVIEEKEKISGDSGTEIFGFVVRLDAPVDRPDGFFRTKIIYNNGRVKKT